MNVDLVSEKVLYSKGKVTGVVRFIGEFSPRVTCLEFELPDTYRTLSPETRETVFWTRFWEGLDAWVNTPASAFTDRVHPLW